MSNSELQRIVELEGRLARIEEFISPNPRVPRDLDGLHAELVRLTDKIGSARYLAENLVRSFSDWSITPSELKTKINAIVEILAAP